MNTFWIVESVVDEDDWDCARVLAFRSFDEAVDYCGLVIRDWETDIRFEDKSDDGYKRYIVYDTMCNDPWFVIHQATLEEP